MRSTPFLLLAAALVLPAAGCGPATEEDLVADEELVDIDGPSGKEDSIAPADNPRNLVGTLETRAETLKGYGFNRTVQVPAARLPWSSDYWPFIRDGIHHRWQGSGEPSPMEKYGRLYLTEEETRANIEWIKDHHGSRVSNVQSWFGICPGWTASAIMEKAPVKAVTVKIVKRGSKTYLKACTAAEAGAANSPCTRFETGDLTGLLAEIYNVAPSKFIGARCDTDTDDFRLDADGRVIQTNCRQNAGSLFLTATNFIGKAKRAFALNAVNNAEVWNQPAYAYKLTRWDNKTAVEAAKLVGGPEETSYKWNTAAKGFRHVVMELNWAVEASPPRGRPELRSSGGTYEFILELDSAGKVVGGEWIGSSKTNHPPFYWSPLSPNDDSSTRKAPGLKYKQIKAILTMAQKA